MKTRPRLFKAMFLYLGCIALAIPLQIMLLYGHPPTELVAVLTKLTPLNWAIMLAAPLVGWLVYEASPLALVAVPMLGYLVVANNWLVAEVSTDYSPLVAGLSSGFFLLSLSPLLTRRTLSMLLHPERRWWLTPSRRRAEVPMVICNDGFEFIVNTFDISEGGVFVPMWPVRPREPRTYLTSMAPGKIVKVFLDLKTAARVECQAQVVRYADATGLYPSGIGLQFLDLGGRERRTLADFAQAR